MGCGWLFSLTRWVLGGGGQSLSDLFWDRYRNTACGFWYVLIRGFLTKQRIRKCHSIHETTLLLARVYWSPIKLSCENQIWLPVLAHTPHVYLNLVKGECVQIKTYACKNTAIRDHDGFETWEAFQNEENIIKQKSQYTEFWIYGPLVGTYRGSRYHEYHCPTLIQRYHYQYKVHVYLGSQKATFCVSNCIFELVEILSEDIWVHELICAKSMFVFAQLKCSPHKKNSTIESGTFEAAIWENTECHF